MQQIWLLFLGVEWRHSLSNSGVAFRAQFKSIKEWNLIMEKMEKRLVGWKKIYLSLSSLPTYFMSRRGVGVEWDDPMKWSSSLPYASAHP